MLVIDVQDFRPKSVLKIEVDEDDIATGLTSLGEEWKSPLALRIRIKPMMKKDPFAKAARVKESDDEWRINVYVPVIRSAVLVPKYEATVNRFIGKALMQVAQGRGSKVDAKAAVSLGFVIVKRAQGSK